MDNSQLTQLTQDKQGKHHPEQALIDKMNDVSEIAHLNRDKEDQTNYSDVFGESVANMDQIPRFGAQKGQDDVINSQKMSNRNNNNMTNSQESNKFQQQKLGEQKSPKSQHFQQQQSQENSQLIQQQSQQNKENSESQSQQQQLQNESGLQQQQNQSKSQQQQDNDSKNQNQSQLSNQNKDITQTSEQIKKQQEEEQIAQEVTFKPASYKTADELEKEKNERLKERNYMNQLYNLAENLVKQEDKVREMQEILLQDREEIFQTKLQKSDVMKNSDRVIQERKVTENVEELIEKEFYKSLKKQIVQTMAASSYIEKKNVVINQQLETQQSKILEMNKTLGNFTAKKQTYVDNISKLEQEIKEIKLQSENQLRLAQTSPQFDQMNSITEVKSEFTKDEKSIIQHNKDMNYLVQQQQQIQKKPRNKMLQNMWMNEKESYADNQLFGIPMDKKKKQNLKPLHLQQKSQTVTSNMMRGGVGGNQIMDQLNYLASNDHLTQQQQQDIQHKSIDHSMFQLAKANKEQFLNQYRLNQQEMLRQQQSNSQHSRILRDFDASNNNISQLNISRSKASVIQPVLAKNSVRIQKQKLQKLQQIQEEQEKIKRGEINPYHLKQEKKLAQQIQQKSEESTPINSVAKSTSKRNSTPKKSLNFGQKQQQLQQQQQQQIVVQDDKALQQQKEVKFDENNNNNVIMSKNLSPNKNNNNGQGGRFSQQQQSNRYSLDGGAQSILQQQQLYQQQQLLTYKQIHGNQRIINPQQQQQQQQ